MGVKSFLLPKNPLAFLGFENMKITQVFILHKAMIFLWIFFELFIFFTGLMRKASERPESTEIKQESREPRRVRLRVTEINRSTTLPEAPRVGCPMDCIATDVCWHLIERERQRLRRPWLYLRLLGAKRSAGRKCWRRRITVSPVWAQRVKKLPTQPVFARRA